MPRHAWTLVPTHTVARAPAHRACRYDIGEPTAARLSVYCSCNVCLLHIMPELGGVGKCLEELANVSGPVCILQL